LSRHLGELGVFLRRRSDLTETCRFSSSNDVLSDVIPQLFPTLVDIATQMLSAPPSQSQEIPTMLHLILKTYKTSIVSNLSTHQQSSDSLVPWGQLLFRVVGLEIPKDAVPADEEEREKSEWWKAKKWAYATLCKLFHRHVTPKTVESSMLILKIGSETHLNFLHRCKRIMVNSPSISSQCMLPRFSRSISNRWSRSFQAGLGFRRKFSTTSSNSSLNGL
jgi:hypothetical protein